MSAVLITLLVVLFLGFIIYTIVKSDNPEDYESYPGYNLEQTEPGINEKHIVYDDDVPYPESTIETSKIIKEPVAVKDLPKKRTPRVYQRKSKKE